MQYGCWCVYYPSPIVIDLNGDGFAMSNLASGVVFPIGPTTLPYRISWTEPSSDDAWLVLDRNGDGAINDGTELFGNATPQPPGANAELNGFRALAVFDEVSGGGNQDGQIDASDRVYVRLRLWFDRNHNGVAEASELESLSARDVRGISLRYQTSRFTDQFGNAFRFRARVFDSKNSSIGKWAYDVFLRSTRMLSF